MNWCIIIIALHVSCYMHCDGLIDIGKPDVPAELNDDFRAYLEEQISSRCRKNTGYEGDINISHCYWLAYTRDRLCCYYRIPGSPREWYHAVDDCYEHCRSSKCRYCLDPPSRYQTTTPAPPPSCFPSAARVNLQTGETVTMSELQIGDRVQTVSMDGTTKYSRVRAFLKNQYFMTNIYKSISTSQNNTINLSGNHLIYARKSYGERFHPIYADRISIGNELLVPGSDDLAPVKVVNVSASKMQGNYVPLTREGNIVVDGMLASCHSSTDHDLAHFGTTPIQWSPEILKAIFGEENGTQIYVIIAAQFGRLTLP